MVAAACSPPWSSSTPASAKIIEVGRTDAAPACPASPCLAVSRTTGYQIKVADERSAFVVPEDGKIVAWTIRSASPRPSRSRSSTRASAARRPRVDGPAPRQDLFSRVVTQSPVQQLAGFFGQTVQFPLGRSLNVKKGYVIALTVPTWAPALTPLLTDHSSWRASRPKGKCNDTGTQTAQTDARARRAVPLPLQGAADLLGDAGHSPGTQPGRDRRSVGSRDGGGASLTPAARSGTCGAL